MDTQNISISKDKSLLNLELIIKFLKKSYWASERSSEQIKKSIDHSVCYGIYEDDEQIGFARVISDEVTFGYIGDVFIIESKRGRQYSKILMDTIFIDPQFIEVKNWYLITKDAQGLYKKYGFQDFNTPGKSIMHAPSNKLKIDTNDRF